jgi:hypothetical protein
MIGESRETIRLIVGRYFDCIQARLIYSWCDGLNTSQLDHLLQTISTSVVRSATAPRDRVLVAHII